MDKLCDKILNLGEKYPGPVFTTILGISAIISVLIAIGLIELVMVIVRSPILIF